MYTSIDGLLCETRIFGEITDQHLLAKLQKGKPAAEDSSEYENRRQRTPEYESDPQPKTIYTPHHNGVIGAGSEGPLKVSCIAKHPTERKKPSENSIHSIKSPANSPPSPPGLSPSPDEHIPNSRDPKSPSPTPRQASRTHRKSESIINRQSRDTASQHPSQSTETPKLKQIAPASQTYLQSPSPPKEQPSVEYLELPNETLRRPSSSNPSSGKAGRNSHRSIRGNSELQSRSTPISDSRKIAPALPPASPEQPQAPSSSKAEPRSTGEVLKNLLPGRRKIKDLHFLPFEEPQGLTKFDRDIRPFISRCIENAQSNVLLCSSIALHLVLSRRDSGSVPTILIICSSDRAVRKIERILAKAPQNIIDRNYYHLHVVKDRVKQKGYSVTGLLDIQKSDAGYSTQLNGVPIWIRPEGAAEGDEQGVIKATLGGVVLIDGVLYGLTVRHALGLDDKIVKPDAGEERQEKYSALAALNSSASGSETCSEGDDDQTYSSSASSYISSDDSESEDEDRDEEVEKDSITIGSDTKRLPTSNNFRQAKPLGVIEKTLAGSADCPFSYEEGTEPRKFLFEGDWALVKLEQHEVSFLPNIVPRAGFLHDLPNTPSTPDSTVALTSTLPILCLSIKSVFAMTGSGMSSGKLLGTMSSVKLPGRRRFTDAYCIHMQEKLVDGDSGSWIIDDSFTGVYGQVYAACENLPYAYAIPLQAILSDIKDKLRMEGKLPDWSDMSGAACFGIGKGSQAQVVNVPVALPPLGQPDVHGSSGLVEDLVGCVNVDVNVKGDSRAGGSVLLLPVHNRHKGAAEVSLERGADLKSKDKGGLAPLFRAAYNGQVDVALVLLEKGADLESKDNNGWDTLRWAAYRGHEGVVLVLLEKGAAIESKDKYGMTALHEAASMDHGGVAKVLLEREADLESKDKLGLTPLLRAALKGNGGVARVLLERGANVESKDNGGLTPLHWAAYKGHEDVAKALLECGADVESKDNSGLTPLHQAASKGCADAVKILLTWGAAINTEDNHGRTSLYIAVIGGHIPVVELLLEQGADVDFKDQYVWNRLYEAASKGHKGVAKVLLKKGAALESKDRPGMVPLHKAAPKGHEGVAKFRLERGVSVEPKDKYSKTLPHNSTKKGPTIVDW